MQRRKAAASVFMEQNAAMIDDFESADEDARVSTESQAPAYPVGTAQQAPAAPPPLLRHRQITETGLKTSEELQLEKEPIHVRETGFAFWRQVVVPPNVYVVHTRMGHAQPVTLGLGRSFRYRPATDAYLVVPAAMQTIGVVANCISQEKQGINVLAYVQWQIADFGVAYRKLDFSDSRDPLGIVNAQLREQAEAAIKDKIATMSVEEVLTDKEPIIDELTTRLKAVAEGRGQSAAGDNEGLGIKIVTVQIKEALVSSQRLWENLQAPFRHEKETAARISFLNMQESIRQKELATRQQTETSEAETRVAIERIAQSTQTEALELRLAEEAKRYTHEQEAARGRIALAEETMRVQRVSEQRLQAEAANAQQEQALARLRFEQAAALERARLDAESLARQKSLQVEQALHELAEALRLAERQAQADEQQLSRAQALRLREVELQRELHAAEAVLQTQQQSAALARQREEALAKLELEEAAQRVRHAQAEHEATLARLQQEARNVVGERALAAQLVERLPALAEALPAIHELKVIQTGDGAEGLGALARFVAKVQALAESLGINLRRNSADGEGRVS